MENSNTESLDSTGRRKSFGRLMNRFAEKTSMQGVGYISSAKLPGARVVWVLLLFGAIGAMTFHLYYLCNQFFSFPSVTKVSLGFSNLEMPAVTICNVNPIKRSKINLMSRELKELVEAVNPRNLNVGPKTPDPPKPTTKPPPKRKKRFIDEFRNLNLSKFESSEEENSDEDENEGEKNRIQEIEDTFRSIYMDHSRETRIDAGHTMEKMLLSCSFNKKNCYYDNFTLYQSPQYGNCYTLEPKKYIMSAAGPQHGLVIILYLENVEYLRGITQGNGIRVAIHDKDTFPFPSDEGLFASSSFETSIGLKLVDIVRKSDPYGNCTDGSEFKKLFNKEYSRHACLITCEQRNILKRCSCFDEESAELFITGNIKNVRPCRSRTERKCAKDIMKQFRKRQINCDCPNPCKERSYQLTVSNRQWPTEEYSVVLLQGICEDSELADLCSTLMKADKRNLNLNFLKLVIYYESLNYEKVEESAEIEDAQFLSDVGGALGLWIGLSVLSIFEVFQLFIEMCDYGCHKCQKNKDTERKKKAREANRRLQEQQRRNSRYGEISHIKARENDYSIHNNRSRDMSTTYDEINLREGFDDNLRYGFNGNYNEWGFDKDPPSYKIYRGPTS